MPQSGVGSMQGSNEDCLPMKGHTGGGDAPTVLLIERTHRGGDALTMKPNKRTNKFFWMKQSDAQY